jgi:hypothetical protein
VRYIGQVNIGRTRAFILQKGSQLFTSNPLFLVSPNPSWRPRRLTRGRVLILASRKPSRGSSPKLKIRARPRQIIIFCIPEGSAASSRRCSSTSCSSRLLSRPPFASFRPNIEQWLLLDTLCTQRNFLPNFDFLLLSQVDLAHTWRGFEYRFALRRKLPTREFILAGINFARSLYLRLTAIDFICNLKGELQ